MPLAGLELPEPFSDDWRETWGEDFLEIDALSASRADSLAVIVCLGVSKCGGDDLV